METSLADAIADILIRIDPIEIYFSDVDNKDEYRFEAAEIARNFLGCSSEEACLDLIYGVFKRAFSSKIAGDRDRFAPIAAEVWKLRGRRSDAPEPG